MSYIMLNGTDNPRELIFNGTQPQCLQCLVYNGEIVWGAKTLTCYRVYIMWDPEKTENLCIDGVWVDNQTVTTDEVYDGSYKNGQWSSLTNSEMTDFVTNNGSACAKYCQGYFFRISPDFDLSNLQFMTGQYYQSKGDVTVTIEEQYSDGSGDITFKTIAEKTVAMAANTTYTINRGDGV